MLGVRQAYSLGGTQRQYKHLSVCKTALQFLHALLVLLRRGLSLAQLLRLVGCYDWRERQDDKASLAEVGYR